MPIISVVSGSAPPTTTQPPLEVTPTAATHGKSTAAKVSQPQPPPPPPPPTKPYTVDLSSSARAKSLKLEGKTPAEIAQLMNIDLKTVDRYLNITVAPTTASAPVGAAQATARPTESPKPAALSQPAAFAQPAATGKATATGKQTGKPVAKVG